MRRGVEVSGEGKAKADQSKECRDRVDDQDGGKRMPGARRKGEIRVLDLLLCLKRIYEED